ncbi:sulfate transporter family-domain-containing protein [Syncephalastrum racemosum]|uniref:Sulfate transporter family-domain-containing protein n=1 Tax=Syncephalastrum racemosum TaxID=13706 RepID=A0A1X2HW69_SYNRA|nr:sulfate transporter family-domain-containing protein [Syncephalastrum racemosum]
MIESNNPIVLDYEPVTTRERIAALKRRLPSYIRTYLLSFFPIFQWITRYRTSWLLQDMIAGVTVGMVLVPQGIAYAKIANLDPQYGLYTSFVGACLYCFLGTSKDISMGPITVVSLLVGRSITTVSQAHPDITGPEVAVYLSMLTGMIALAIGMIRLGILVDFIPAPAIAGYMTGSAITISLGQWGKLTGIKLNTHQSPYLVVGDFFANLGHVHIDIAFGLVGLISLYLIKFISTRLAKGAPKLQQRILFYFGIMRSGSVVIVATLISFVINMNRSKSDFSIIEKVPAGLDALGVPRMNLDILGDIGGTLPSIIIIMILEHVSVAKSFGRIADYTIDADQEIITIGITNMVGAFFGAYPGTGAFSRTAIMARSGVKSPMAGVFSAAVVILALYVLTPAFYYIPEATLAAVVIHAVSDLVSGPKYVKELWKASKLETLVFASAVLITFFVDVETGIYVAVALSLFIMLLRIARPPVTLLAPAPIQPNKSASCIDMDHYVYVDERDVHFQQRLVPLPPGVIVVRIDNAIIYPNAAHISESIIQAAKSRTRRGGESQQKQMLWNQPLEKSNHLRDSLPVLSALVLDMSAVTRMDSTALQALVSCRDTLDRYAGQPVAWHFSSVKSVQVRNDLIQFGFGLVNRLCEEDDDSTTCGSPTSTASCDSDATATAIQQDLQTKSNRVDSTKVASTTLYHLERGEYPYYVFEEQAPTMDLTDILHPYYSEHNIYQRPDYHDCLPRDRYSGFHWDVESAMRYIMCHQTATIAIPAGQV